MCNGMFRALRADEIECRVQQITEKGCSLLLYKDARCDQNILDETVGAMNWQRGHLRDNANCVVSIWDDKKSQWVSKEDTGTESNTEKEKGLASDSFKRACFNWGIGRELYTAPFIWINPDGVKIIKDGNRYKTFDRFTVKRLEVTEHVITALEIENKGKTVYTYRAGAPIAAPKTTEKAAPKTPICKYCGNPITPVTGKNGARTPEQIAEYTGGICWNCFRRAEQGAFNSEDKAWLGG